MNTESIQRLEKWLEKVTEAFLRADNTPDSLHIDLMAAQNAYFLDKDSSHREQIARNVFAAAGEPYPGKGYRMLAKGEYFSEPLVEGDEFSGDGKDWRRADLKANDGKQSHRYWYRRKLLE